MHAVIVERSGAEIEYFLRRKERVCRSQIGQSYLLTAVKLLHQLGFVHHGFRVLFQRFARSNQLFYPHVMLFEIKIDLFVCPRRLFEYDNAVFGHIIEYGIHLVAHKRQQPLRLLSAYRRRSKLRISIEQRLAVFRRKSVQNLSRFLQSVLHCVGAEQHIVVGHQLYVFHSAYCGKRLGMKLFDTLYLVIEKGYSHGHFEVCRENADYVSRNAESAFFLHAFLSHIARKCELVYQLVSVEFISYRQLDYAVLNVLFARHVLQKRLRGYDHTVQLTRSPIVKCVYPLRYDTLEISFAQKQKLFVGRQQAYSVPVIIL